jgi:bifunctional ADP-heptose synthase (sugar kinase/adenylyltransferase)
MRRRGKGAAAARQRSRRSLGGAPMTPQRRFRRRKSVDRTSATRSPTSARLPRPLVFTNGVFDVLHRGHVPYLIRRARSAHRRRRQIPTNRCEGWARAATGPQCARGSNGVLAALAAVDLVVPVRPDTPRG